MPLHFKKNVFKSKTLVVHEGVSDVSNKPVIQLVLVSPTTKERRAINVGVARRGEIADALEAAAQAVRRGG